MRCLAGLGLELAERSKSGSLCSSQRIRGSQRFSACGAADDALRQFRRVREAVPHRPTRPFVSDRGAGACFAHFAAKSNACESVGLLHGDLFTELHVERLLFSSCVRPATTGASAVPARNPKGGWIDCGSQSTDPEPSEK